jgi:hypothetical protein
MSLLIKRYLHHPVTYFLVDSNILLSTIFSHALVQCPFFAYL